MKLFRLFAFLIFALCFFFSPPRVYRKGHCRKHYLSQRENPSPQVLITPKSFRLQFFSIKVSKVQFIFWGTISKMLLSLAVPVKESVSNLRRLRPETVGDQSPPSKSKPRGREPSTGSLN